MAEIPTLIQTCPDGCPQPCGGEPAVTFTCVSRTGSGNLRGWSKYQNENSGDWNQRKYTRVSYSFSTEPDLLHQVFYTLKWPIGVPGTPPPVCSGLEFIHSSYYIFARDAIWDVTSNAKSQDGTYKRKICLVDSGGSPIVFSAPYSLSGILFISNAILSDILCSTQKVNLACHMSEGCATPSGYVQSSDGVPGQAFSELTIADSVAAALARGTPTVGSLCKTSAGTIGSTSAGSTTQISVSSVTSVVATLACTGLTAATAYEITVTIKRYTAGGGAYVDSITDTITFTASGATEEIEYNVPVNTDYDYELSAATIAAA